jgi:hypothetical protein
MSLDATILAVDREGADVVLTLGPRIDDAEKLSIAGQGKLRILNATYEPPVGCDLWGGDSFVELLTQPRRWYTRIGYTKLKEGKPWP